MRKLTENNDFTMFLQQFLKNIQCSNETLAYIQSIFIEYLKTEKDLSNKSIILEFAKAKNNYSFVKFQEIGDWLLFGLSMFPNHFKNSSQEYYISIGQNSYYKCHKMLNRQWPVFEELSDNFDSIIEKIQLENNFNEPVLFSFSKIDFS